MGFLDSWLACFSARNNSVASVTQARSCCLVNLALACDSWAALGWLERWWRGRRLDVQEKVRSKNSLEVSSARRMRIERTVHSARKAWWPAQCGLWN